MAFVRVAFAASLLAVSFFVVLRADPAPDSALLDAARRYESWARVDNLNHWMPTLCSYQPGRTWFSASDDPLTHGRKLYPLSARDRDAYANGGVQPDGQTIVKEGWTPRPWREGDPQDYGNVATLNGEKWVKDRRMGLFLMHKSAGVWSYAVATPGGERLLDPIATATCRGCHESAKPDRLFGLPR